MKNLIDKKDFDMIRDVLDDIELEYKVFQFLEKLEQ